MSAPHQALIASKPGAMSASLTDSSWTASGSTATIATANRTITVPTGNRGVLILAIVPLLSGAMLYSINNAAFVAFNQNDQITVTSGQTLKFEITGSGSGDSAVGNVTDATTGVKVGAVNISHP